MKKKGFTIIEVTLVLGIAGLIMLLVFIALPNLTRSQRDTQRKTDMAKIADAVKKFQSNNNRGSLPNSDAIFASAMAEYFPNNGLSDPDGPSYNYIYLTCGGTRDQVCDGFRNHDRPDMLLVVPAHCGEAEDGEPIPVKSDNPRKAALVYKLEAGTNGTYFCYEL